MVRLSLFALAAAAAGLAAMFLNREREKREHDPYGSQEFFGDQIIPPAR